MPPKLSQVNLSVPVLSPPGEIRLKKLLEYLDEDPDDTFCLFATAMEYVGLGRSNEGLATFEKLIAVDPNYVGAYYHWAKLLEARGEKERALAIYRRGIDVAEAMRDFHAKSELQAALIEAEDDY